jgi:hypothetical protein
MALHPLAERFAAVAPEYERAALVARMRSIILSSETPPELPQHVVLGLTHLAEGRWG